MRKSVPTFAVPATWYLSLLWRIYIPCVASLFYNNQFWKNRKRKVPHTMNDGSYTPAILSSCLPPSVVCQGTGAGILWSLIPRASCPTVAKLQSAEDNRKESIGPDQLYHTEHGRSWQSEHCGTFKETHICFWPPWSSKFIRNGDLPSQAKAASSASRQVSIGTLNS